MIRRASNAVVRRAAPAPAALVVASTQQRNLEILSTYWLASWCMCWQWTFFTCFPIVVMDLFKPSAVVNKLPLLHAFHEKRVEMKLRAALDNTVTAWSEELDAASIDDAIARAF
jgi:hypothetical protein